jgi:Leucine rich repeat
MGLKPLLSFFVYFSLLLVPHSLSQSAINDAQSLLLLKSAIDVSNSLPWRLDSASSLCTSWIGVKECSPDGRVTKLVLESLNLTGALKHNLLSGLDQLRVLSFKSNSLSGEIPDLSSLSNLKSLYLNQNNFSGKIPSSISSLHRLKIIVLSDNLLSGSIPVELTSVQRLYSLQLQNNQLTGGIPPFKQFSLRLFNVSFNNLSGKIPLTIALSQFNISSFSHNPHLCGQQINQICTRDSFIPPSPSPNRPEQPYPSASINSFPPLVTSNQENKHTKRLIAIIAGSIAGGILLFALMSILLFVLIFKKKKKKVAEAGAQPREHQQKTTETETEPTTLQRRDEPQRPAGKQAFSWETESSGKLVFCGGVGDMYSMEELLRASAETLGRGTARKNF